MYTRKQLRAAAGIISQIAQANHVSEAQVRMEMEEAMNYGRNNPASEVQAKWSTFHYAGSEPTLEEFILWVSAMVKDRMS